MAVILAATFCLVAAMFYSSPSASGAGAGVAVDVELAFDTTGSMALSLDRARQDAQAILDGVRQVVPDARFSVVSFRDPGNPGGEYEILQAMTTNGAAIDDALRRLHAVSNPSPSNLKVESYNLAFHRSYADAALGWRTESRKIVVVVGDAEPYGGGLSNITGCHDNHRDPDGFNVRDELTKMQAAQRTLVMIRAISSNTTTSLECYSSLASLTYPGGAARDSTANDIVAPLLGLVRSAVAPITIIPTLPLALPRSTIVVKLRVANPNSVSLQLQSLSLALPAGFVPLASSPPASIAQRTFTWTNPVTLAPKSGMTASVRVKTAARALRASLFATGTFQLLPDGAVFTSSSRLVLPVTRSISIRVAHGTPVDGRPTGTAKLTLGGRGSWSYARGSNVSGRFAARIGKNAVTLRPTRFTLALVRGRAVVRLTVRVTSPIRGSCLSGRIGLLTVSDKSFGLTAGSGSARLSVRSCGLNRRWPLPAQSIQPA